MKEREFQGWVTDVARRFGWRVWHVPMPVRQIGGNQIVPDSRGRGLPDLIMLHDDPPRLIFAELKGTGGKLSVEQKEFLKLAGGVAEDWMIQSGSTVISPIGVYAWRPGDEGIIEAILRSKVIA